MAQMEGSPPGRACTHSHTCDVEDDLASGYNIPLPELAADTLTKSIAYDVPLTTTDVFNVPVTAHQLPASVQNRLLYDQFKDAMVSLNEVPKLPSSLHPTLHSISRGSRSGFSATRPIPNTFGCDELPPVFESAQQQHAWNVTGDTQGAEGPYNRWIPSEAPVNTLGYYAELQQTDYDRHARIGGAGGHPGGSKHFVEGYSGRALTRVRALECVESLFAMSPFADEFQIRSENETMRMDSAQPPESRPTLKASATADRGGESSLPRKASAPHGSSTIRFDIGLPPLGVQQESVPTTGSHESCGAEVEEDEVELKSVAPTNTGPASTKVPTRSTSSAGEPVPHPPHPTAPNNSGGGCTCIAAGRLPVFPTQPARIPSSWTRAPAAEITRLAESVEYAHDYRLKMLAAAVQRLRESVPETEKLDESVTLEDLINQKGEVLTNRSSGSGTQEWWREEGRVYPDTETERCEKVLRHVVASTFARFEVTPAPGAECSPSGPNFGTWRPFLQAMGLDEKEEERAAAEEVANLALARRRLRNLSNRTRTETSGYAGSIPLFAKRIYDFKVRRLMFARKVIANRAKQGRVTSLNPSEPSKKRPIATEDQDSETDSSIIPSAPSSAPTSPALAASTVAQRLLNRSRALRALRKQQSPTPNTLEDSNGELSDHSSGSEASDEDQVDTWTSGGTITATVTEAKLSECQDPPVGPIRDASESDVTDHEKHNNSSVPSSPQGPHQVPREIVSPNSSDDEQASDSNSAESLVWDTVGVEFAHDVLGMITDPLKPEELIDGDGAQQDGACSSTSLDSKLSSIPGSPHPAARVASIRAARSLSRAKDRLTAIASVAPIASHRRAQAVAVPDQSILSLSTHIPGASERSAAPRTKKLSRFRRFYQRITAQQLKIAAFGSIPRGFLSAYVPTTVTPAVGSLWMSETDSTSTGSPSPSQSSSIDERGDSTARKRSRRSHRFLALGVRSDFTAPGCFPRFKLGCYRADGNFDTPLGQGKKKDAHHRTTGNALPQIEDEDMSQVDTLPPFEEAGIPYAQSTSTCATILASGSITQIATAHSDFTISIRLAWGANTVHYATLLGHRATIWNMTFHPTHPHILASSSMDGMVILWDTVRVLYLASCKIMPTLVSSLAFVPLDPETTTSGSRSRFVPVRPNEINSASNAGSTASGDSTTVDTSVESVTPSSNPAELDIYSVDPTQTHFAPSRVLPTPAPLPTAKPANRTSSARVYTPYDSGVNLLNALDDEHPGLLIAHAQHPRDSISVASFASALASTPSDSLVAPATLAAELKDEARSKLPAREPTATDTWGVSSNASDATRAEEVSRGLPHLLDKATGKPKFLRGLNRKHGSQAFATALANAQSVRQPSSGLEESADETDADSDGLSLDLSSDSDEDEQLSARLQARATVASSNAIVQAGSGKLGLFLWRYPLPAPPPARVPLALREAVLILTRATMPPTAVNENLRQLPIPAAGPDHTGEERDATPPATTTLPMRKSSRSRRSARGLRPAESVQDNILRSPAPLNERVRASQPSADPVTLAATTGGAALLQETAVAADSASGPADLTTVQSRSLRGRAPRPTQVSSSTEAVESTLDYSWSFNLKPVPLPRKAQTPGYQLAFALQAYQKHGSSEITEGLSPGTAACAISNESFEGLLNELSADDTWVRISYSFALRAGIKELRRLRTEHGSGASTKDIQNEWLSLLVSYATKPSKFGASDKAIASVRLYASPLALCLSRTDIAYAQMIASDAISRWREAREWWLFQIWLTSKRRASAIATVVGVKELDDSFDPNSLVRLGLAHLPPSKLSPAFRMNDPDPEQGVSDRDQRQQNIPRFLHETPVALNPTASNERSVWRCPRALRMLRISQLLHKSSVALATLRSDLENNHDSILELNAIRDKFEDIPCTGGPMCQCALPDCVDDPGDDCQDPENDPVVEAEEMLILQFLERLTGGSASGNRQLVDSSTDHHSELFVKWFTAAEEMYGPVFFNPTDPLFTQRSPTRPSTTRPDALPSLQASRRRRFGRSDNTPFSIFDTPAGAVSTPSTARSDFLDPQLPRGPLSPTSVQDSPTSLDFASDLQTSAFAAPIQPLGTIRRGFAGVSSLEMKSKSSVKLICDGYFSPFARANASISSSFIPTGPATSAASTSERRLSLRNYDGSARKGFSLGGYGVRLGLPHMWPLSRCFVYAPDKVLRGNSLIPRLVTKLALRWRQARLTGKVFGKVSGTVDASMNDILFGDKPLASNNYKEVYAAQCNDHISATRRVKRVAAAKMLDEFLRYIQVKVDGVELQTSDLMQFYHEDDDFQDADHLLYTQARSIDVLTNESFPIHDSIFGDDGDYDDFVMQPKTAFASQLLQRKDTSLQAEKGTDTAPKPCLRWLLRRFIARDQVRRKRGLLQYAAKSPITSGTHSTLALTAGASPSLPITEPGFLDQEPGFEAVTLASIQHALHYFGPNSTISRAHEHAKEHLSEPNNSRHSAETDHTSQISQPTSRRRKRKSKSKRTQVSPGPSVGTSLMLPDYSIPLTVLPVPLLAIAQSQPENYDLSQTLASYEPAIEKFKCIPDGRGNEPVDANAASSSSSGSAFYSALRCLPRSSFIDLFPVSSQEAQEMRYAAKFVAEIEPTGISTENLSSFSLEGDTEDGDELASPTSNHASAAPASPDNSDRGSGIIRALRFTPSAKHLVMLVTGDYFDKLEAKHEDLRNEHIIGATNSTPYTKLAGIACETEVMPGYFNPRFHVNFPDNPVHHGSEAGGNAKVIHPGLRNIRSATTFTASALVFNWPPSPSQLVYSATRPRSLTSSATAVAWSNKELQKSVVSVCNNPTMVLSTFHLSLELRVPNVSLHSTAIDIHNDKLLLLHVPASVYAPTQLPPGLVREVHSTLEYCHPSQIESPRPTSAGNVCGFKRTSSFTSRKPSLASIKRVRLDLRVCGTCRCCKAAPPATIFPGSSDRLHEPLGQAADFDESGHNRATKVLSELEAGGVAALPPVPDIKSSTALAILKNPQGTPFTQELAIGSDSKPPPKNPYENDLEENGQYRVGFTIMSIYMRGHKAIDACRRRGYALSRLFNSLPHAAGHSMLVPKFAHGTEVENEHRLASSALFGANLMLAILSQSEYQLSQSNFMEIVQHAVHGTALASENVKSITALDRLSNAQRVLAVKALIYLASYLSAIRTATKPAQRVAHHASEGVNDPVCRYSLREGLAGVLSYSTVVGTASQVCEATLATALTIIGERAFTYFFPPQWLHPLDNIHRQHQLTSRMICRELIRVLFAEGYANLTRHTSSCDSKAVLCKWPLNDLNLTQAMRAAARFGTATLPPLETMHSPIAVTSVALAAALPNTITGCLNAFGSHLAMDSAPDSGTTDRDEVLKDGHLIAHDPLPHLVLRPPPRCRQLSRPLRHALQLLLAARYASVHEQTYDLFDELHRKLFELGLGPDMYNDFKQLKSFVASLGSQQEVSAKATDNSELSGSSDVDNAADKPCGHCPCCQERGKQLSTYSKSVPNVGAGPLAMLNTSLLAKSASRAELIREFYGFYDDLVASDAVFGAHLPSTAHSASTATSPFQSHRLSRVPLEESPLRIDVPARSPRTLPSSTSSSYRTLAPQHGLSQPQMPGLRSSSSNMSPPMSVRGESLSEDLCSTQSVGARESESDLDPQFRDALSMHEQRLNKLQDDDQFLLRCMQNPILRQPPPRVALTVVSIKPESMGKVMASTETAVTLKEVQETSFHFLPPSRLAWGWDVISAKFSPSGKHIVVGRSVHSESSANQALKVLAAEAHRIAEENSKRDAIAIQEESARIERATQLIARAQALHAKLREHGQDSEAKQTLAELRAIITNAQNVSEKLEASVEKLAKSLVEHLKLREMALSILKRAWTGRQRAILYPYNDWGIETMCDMSAPLKALMLRLSATGERPLTIPALSMYELNIGHGVLSLLSEHHPPTLADQLNEVAFVGNRIDMPPPTTLFTSFQITGQMRARRHFSKSLNRWKGPNVQTNPLFGAIRGDDYADSLNGAHLRLNYFPRLTPRALALEYTRADMASLDEWRTIQTSAARLDFVLGSYFPNGAVTAQVGGPVVDVKSEHVTNQSRPLPVPTEYYPLSYSLTERNRYYNKLRQTFGWQHERFSPEAARMERARQQHLLSLPGASLAGGRGDVVGVWASAGQFRGGFTNGHFSASRQPLSLTLHRANLPPVLVIARPNAAKELSVLAKKPSHLLDLCDSIFVVPTDDALNSAESSTMGTMSNLHSLHSKVVTSPPVVTENQCIRLRSSEEVSDQSEANPVIISRRPVSAASLPVDINSPWVSPVVCELAYDCRKILLQLTTVTSHELAKRASVAYLPMTLTPAYATPKNLWSEPLVMDPRRILMRAATPLGVIHVWYRVHLAQFGPYPGLGKDGRKIAIAADIGAQLEEISTAAEEAIQLQHAKNRFAEWLDAQRGGGAKMPLTHAKANAKVDSPLGHVRYMIPAAHTAADVLQGPIASIIQELDPNSSTGAEDEDDRSLGSKRTRPEVSTQTSGLVESDRSQTRLRLEAADTTTGVPQEATSQVGELSNKHEEKATSELRANYANSLVEAIFLSRFPDLAPYCVSPQDMNPRTIALPFGQFDKNMFLSPMQVIVNALQSHPQAFAFLEAGCLSRGVPFPKDIPYFSRVVKSSSSEPSVSFDESSPKAAGKSESADDRYGAKKGEESYGFATYRDYRIGMELLMKFIQMKRGIAALSPSTSDHSTPYPISRISRLQLPVLLSPSPPTPATELNPAGRSFTLSSDLLVRRDGQDHMTYLHLIADAAVSAAYDTATSAMESVRKARAPTLPGMPPGEPSRVAAAASATMAVTRLIHYEQSTFVSQEASVALGGGPTQASAPLPVAGPAIRRLEQRHELRSLLPPTRFILPPQLSLTSQDMNQLAAQLSAAQQLTKSPPPRSIEISPPASPSCSGLPQLPSPALSQHSVANSSITRTLQQPSVGVPGVMSPSNEHELTAKPAISLLDIYTPSDHSRTLPQPAGGAPRSDSSTVMSVDPLRGINENQTDM